MRSYPIIKRREKAFYWIVFVFTRFLAAAFGDFCARPPIKGGPEFSTPSAVSVALTSMLIIPALGSAGRSTRQRQDRAVRVWPC